VHVVVKGLSCMVAFGTKDNLKFNVCSKLRFGNSLYQGLGFMFSHFGILQRNATIESSSANDSTLLRLRL
jgi:hypothetical protein